PRRDLDLICGAVDDLVGFDSQTILARLAVFSEPANDVAPELSEITVIAFAPVVLEVSSPIDSGVAGHGKCPATAECLAREHRHDLRARERTLRKPQRGRRRLETVCQIGAVKDRQGGEHLAVPLGIINDFPDGVVHRLWGNYDLERAPEILG